LWHCSFAVSQPSVLGQAAPRVLAVVVLPIAQDFTHVVRKKFAMPVAEPVQLIQIAVEQLPAAEPAAVVRQT
jgi:hypothetical protein